MRREYMRRSFPLLNLWINDHAIIQIIQQPKPPPRTPNARCAPRYFYAAGRKCADGRRANTNCHWGRVFVCCGRRYPSDDVPSIELGHKSPSFRLAATDGKAGPTVLQG